MIWDISFHFTFSRLCPGQTLGFFQAFAIGTGSTVLNFVCSIGITAKFVYGEISELNMLLFHSQVDH